MKNEIIIIYKLVLFMMIFLISCQKNFYLRGYFTQKQFIEQCRWKEPIKYSYKPDPIYLDSIKSVKDSVELKLFVGTWCSHSEKYVSRFFKIQPDLPIKSIEIISVDTTKKDERQLFKNFKLTKIPSFIFLRDDKEIGRITEKPYKRKLEKEIYKIIKPKK